MRSRNPHAPTRLALERLEDRTVPTTATLSNGVLTVTGSSAADNIQIGQSGGLITVSGVTGTFSAGQVNTITVEASYGNDVVNVAPSVTASLWVFAGSGNDTVTAGGGNARVFGGSGNDTITGGSGVDVLYGGLGTNSVTGQSGDQVSQGANYVSATPSSMAMQIVSLVNQNRAANGLGALQTSGQLTAAADLHAQQMAGMASVVGFNSAMKHTLMGVPMPTFTSRADAVGYDYYTLGENIAYGFGSAESVMDAWMNSAGHRANILNGSFTQIGVSVAYTPEGMPYFAQEFGTPTPSNPTAPAPIVTVGPTTTPAPVTPPTTPPPAPAPAPAPAPITSTPTPAPTPTTQPTTTTPAPTPTPAPTTVVVRDGFGAGTTRAGQIYAVGSDTNVVGTVTIYDLGSGAKKFTLVPYGSSFRGGVRVAVADVTGDGTQDVIVSPGAGTAPLVKVFDGATGALAKSFYAYATGWLGGVFVSAGDVNGDGRADIVTGADAGAGPHVMAYDGNTLAAIRSFYAYDSTFRGGARVAVGDVNGDGKADIITTPGRGLAPLVKVFSGATGGVIQQYNAYASSWTGGVNVATGDVNGDGKADVITGTDSGTRGNVKAFSGVNGSQLANLFTAFSGGTRVSARDVTGDGKAEIISADGRGGRTVRLHKSTGENVLASFLAEPNTASGVYVG